MARILEVSTSGYYRWLENPDGSRSQARMRFDAEVKTCFESSHRRYGSEKIAREMMQQGQGKNRKRVAQSMQRQGLRSKVARKFTVTTTDSNHAFTVAPNIQNREFSVDIPNKV
ncbi:MAG: IS3 family transposase [Chitinivibrionales bacterium]|nr:IS3 family transposase [Chitinivibrionales bacterium]